MTQEQKLSVGLRPWAEADFPLLEKLLGDPAMTEHLGGPESAEQLAKRHQRYLDLRDGEMFVIVVNEVETVGSIGYWPTDWQGQASYETGWSVLPTHQGKGIASQATELILAHIQAHNLPRRYVYAFPSVAHRASNAVCRKAGFTFMDEADFEYPKGHPIRCNVWRFAL